MNEVKKVQIRGGFSDRNKIQPLNTEIQLHDLDERTRHALANLVWNSVQDNCMRSRVLLFLKIIFKPSDVVEFNIISLAVFIDTSCEADFCTATTGQRAD